MKTFKLRGIKVFEELRVDFFTLPQQEWLYAKLNIHAEEDVLQALIS